MRDKRRILVVEDQSLVAETIASALDEDYGVCGESATEALALLEQGGFDLVLLDCLLPGGRAADVMSRADVARVPVILMSGDLERVASLSDGVRPFLSKPFSIAALMDAVQAALSRRG